MNKEEIVNKKFTTVYRGLDEQAVRQHLSEVQKFIDSKDERIRQLEEMLNDRQENLNSFKSVESSINEAILSATKAGDDIKLRAQNLGDSIVEKAHNEAAQIKERAEREATEVRSYTDNLRREAKVFRARYKMLIQAQLDLIETDDWEQMLKLDDENLDKQ